MARMTPAEIAQKAVQRAAAASGDYERGVNAVTVSPGQAAAAKSAKWEAGVQRAISEKRFEKGASAVSLEDWKRATRDKSGRYAQGVAASASKIESFQREFQPFQDAIRERVRAMPDTTIEQRLERARVMAIETSKFRRSGR